MGYCDLAKNLAISRVASIVAPAAAGPSTRFLPYLLLHLASCNLVHSICQADAAIR